MSDDGSCIPESVDPDDVIEPSFSMQHCPVIQHANDVLSSGKETQRALRQLRQSLINCENCPAFGHCEMREHFNMQVDQVVAQILEEWGW